MLSARNSFPLILVALTHAAACSSPPPAETPASPPGPVEEEEPQGRVAGGPCEYVDIVGKCTFNAIEEAAVEDFQCEGGSKKVTFQFAPDDPSAKLEGPEAAQGRLTAGGGQNPSAAWLEASGVKEGVTLSCTRSEIGKGTCSPVVWKFPDLNLDEAPCR